MLEYIGYEKIPTEIAVFDRPPVPGRMNTKFLMALEFHR